MGIVHRTFPASDGTQQVTVFLILSVTTPNSGTSVPSTKMQASKTSNCGIQREKNADDRKEEKMVGRGWRRLYICGATGKKSKHASVTVLLTAFDRHVKLMVTKRARLRVAGRTSKSC